MSAYLFAYFLDNLVITAVFIADMSRRYQWFGLHEYGLFIILLFFGVPFILLVFFMELAMKALMAWEEPHYHDH